MDLAVRIKADIAQFQAQMREVEASVRRAATQGAQSVRPLEDAWKTLGLRSQESIQTAARELGTSFATIKASGTATFSDIQRAQTAYEQKLKGLTTEALPGAKSAVDKARAAFDDMGLSTGIVGTAFRALANPLTLVGTAFAAAGLFVKSTTDAMVANAREARALMAVSGLTAEAADNLADTFTLMGMESGLVTNAMFKMSQELDTGGSGFRRLGVEIHTSAGELKSEGALFLEVRDKIAGLGSAAERNAAIMDVFGRAGRSLAPAFALSRDEFIKFMNEASKYSPWGEEAQQRTMTLIKAQAGLGLAWEGLKLQLGAFVVGPAAAFTKWLTDIVMKMRPGEVALEQLRREIAEFETRVPAGHQGLAQMRKRLAEAEFRELQAGWDREDQAFADRKQASDRIDTETARRRLAEAKAVMDSELGALQIREAQQKLAVARMGMTETEFLTARMTNLAEQEIAVRKAGAVELAVMKGRGASQAEFAEKYQEIAKATRGFEIERLAILGELEKRGAALTLAGAKAYLDFEDAMRKADLELPNNINLMTQAAEQAEKLLVAMGVEGAKAVQSLDDAMRKMDIEVMTHVLPLGAELLEQTSDLDRQYQAAALTLGQQLTPEVERQVVALEKFKTNYDRLVPSQREALDQYVDVQRKLRLVRDAQDFVTAGYTAQEATGLASVRRQLQENRRFFGAFQAGALDFMKQGRSMWEAMRALTVETLGHMSRSLSDVFFNVFTGQVTSAKELWQSFMNSMLRSVSNFLADFAVRQFLEFATGFFGFGGGRAGVGGGGSGGGAGGVAGGIAQQTIAGIAGDAIRKSLGLPSLAELGTSALSGLGSLLGIGGAEAGAFAGSASAVQGAIGPALAAGGGTTIGSTVLAGAGQQAISSGVSAAAAITAAELAAAEAGLGALGPGAAGAAGGGLGAGLASAGFAAIPFALAGITNLLSGRGFFGGAVDVNVTQLRHDLEEQQSQASFATAVPSITSTAGLAGLFNSIAQGSASVPGGFLEAAELQVPANIDRLLAGSLFQGINAYRFLEKLHALDPGNPYFALHPWRGTPAPIGEQVYTTGMSQSEIAFRLGRPETLQEEMARAGPYGYTGAGGNEAVWLQRGGFVRGIGSGDIMPALLEPGEYVVPRRLALEVGPALEAMRHGQPSAGPIINITVSGSAGEAPEAFARRVARAVRDELRRLDDRTITVAGLARG